MNVRITPRGQPHRTDLYGGITRVYSDGRTLFLVAERTGQSGAVFLLDSDALPLLGVAAIALDDEPGDWW